MNVLHVCDFLIFCIVLLLSEVKKLGRYVSAVLIVYVEGNSLLSLLLVDQYSPAARRAIS